MFQNECYITMHLKLVSFVRQQCTHSCCMYMCTFCTHFSHNAHKVRDSPCVYHIATCSPELSPSEYQGRTCDILCCRCHKATFVLDLFSSHKFYDVLYPSFSTFPDKCYDPRVDLLRTERSTLTSQMIGPGTAPGTWSGICVYKVKEACM